MTGGWKRKRIKIEFKNVTSLSKSRHQTIELVSYVQKVSTDKKWKKKFKQDLFIQEKDCKIIRIGRSKSWNDNDKMKIKLFLKHKKNTSRRVISFANFISYEVNLNTILKYNEWKRKWPLQSFQSFTEKFDPQVLTISYYGQVLWSENNGTIYSPHSIFRHRHSMVTF